MRYAGLTDEPAKREQQRGNAEDFRVIQQFSSKALARQWLRKILGREYEDDNSGNTATPFQAEGKFGLNIRTSQNS